jgi:hypothetical protein
MNGELMFAEHKKKIVAAIAAAFLAVLAVFYEVVVEVVTDNLLSTEQPQITDSVTTQPTN